MKPALLILFSLFCINAFSQSPGLIVRPAGGNGITILNPNGDGYSSSTTSGFTTSDITQSEISYKVVPPAIIEPTGDIATGPTGGFTDIVKTFDGSGFYIYSDGTNMLFRLRIGNIISGSKGYSILFDTDNKIGNSGPYADPNFIAPTNTSNGNPGFEYEVVLETNFQVAVFNVDGNSNPGSPTATYPLTTHSQISAALTTDGNNADYFYDWYVPLSAIGSPSSFRLSATTVTSPSSAFQGSRSDIYGIDDQTSTTSDMWTSVINAQPAITLASLTGGSSPSPVCTAAPTINSPINTGSNISVTGSWTRMDVSKPSTATITLYKNGATVNTTSISSGATWNISVPTVSPGDVFYARAQASGESQCLQSPNVTAGCTSTPASATITCASTKGITGTIPLGTTINIYQVSTTNSVPTTTQLTSGLAYTNNASDQTFNYFGTNPQSGNACQGQNGILATNTTYMFITNNGGCLSAPVFICITGSSQNSWNYITSNALTLTTPIYPFHSTVSGSGATSGQLLRLFVNNLYVTSVTASGSAFSFSGLSLTSGDVMRVYAQTSGACMTVSSAFTVSCYTQSPTITTNSEGYLLTTATSISGKSSLIGASVNLYRGTSPSGTLVGSATVNSSGVWTVSSLTLSGAETYYATQTSGGCTSPSSSSATVTALTTTCPVFGSSSYSESASTVGGTITAFTGTVRVYLDGTQIGSTVLSNATVWSIPVNTSYSNTLYPGGMLTVSAQSTGSAESTGCASTASISCSAPTTPSINPTSSTINLGQTVTYSVSNVSSGTWYSIVDNSGSSFAKSIYSGGTGSFNLPTNAFNSAGTYQLSITADKLTGCTKNIAPATVVVNNVSVPVRFLNVSASNQSGLITVKWAVENEVDVESYKVEQSTDGKTFNPIASVGYQISNGVTNNYSYQLSSVPDQPILYFRIKQVDIDGHFTYSKIVSVNVNGNEKITIAPNPSNGNFKITYFSGGEHTIDISVIGTDGRAIATKHVMLHEGTNNIEFSVDAPAGIYFVRFRKNGYSPILKVYIAKR